MLTLMKAWFIMGPYGYSVQNLYTENILANFLQVVTHKPLSWC